MDTYLIDKGERIKAEVRAMRKKEKAAWQEEERGRLLNDIERPLKPIRKEWKWPSITRFLNQFLP